MTPDFTAANLYSPYFRQVTASNRIDCSYLADLIKKPLPTDFFTNFTRWEQLITAADEQQLSQELRQLKTYVFCQLLVRDLAGYAPLEEVMAAMTALADFCCNLTLNFAETLFTKRWGTPKGEESGKEQHLTVISMGKMGGGELNVSSDIDLIFTYPENGITDGVKSIANDEFFTKVCQKIIKLLAEVTAAGQVFRVDLRLRPEGEAGPLCISEGALEEYLIRQGREWERYAWLKARVVSPYPQHINAIITPFIYRKYLDFNSFKEIRNLRRQISGEMARRGNQDNIKLGRGGIREIEFIAQIFQLLRGGGKKELRLQSTRAALAKLAELKIITAAAARILLTSYEFLRRTEHRLQYRQDRQTHVLPAAAAEKAALAAAMAFSSYQDFYAALQTCRREVNRLFNSLLHDDDGDSGNDTPYPDLSTYWTELLSTAKLPNRTAYRFTAAESAKVHGLLLAFKQQHYPKVTNAAGAVIDELIPHFIVAAAELPDKITALTRVLDFTRQCSQRPAYLAFLREYPGIIRRLMALLGKSRWLADYLRQYPVLLDEFLSTELLNTAINWEEQQQELTAKLVQTAADPEAQMNFIRQFQHSHIFRLAVQEIEGLRTVEDISDQLAALADIIIGTAAREVWQNYPKTRKHQGKFAVIAYGKLGGKELSYNSDLDLVYVYQDDHPDINEIYNWYASRLTSYLSAATDSGGLYQLDLRLRPFGDAGFLAADFDFYARYLHHDACTWEHQALTRARIVCGDDNISNKFAELRQNILARTRDLSRLKSDITAMRAKIAAAHPPREREVKYARGGTIDIEFIVQYLILAYSRIYPQLGQNLGNIALLQIAAQLNLITRAQAGATQAAYRDYRKIAHNEVLFDTPPAPDQKKLRQHYKHVSALWAVLFT